MLFLNTRNIFYVHFLIFYLSVVSYAQQAFNISEIEKESYVSTFKLKETSYPGDPLFDVTYYKLNLTISYSPNYLTGQVTVLAKAVVDNLESVFFDLSDNLIVDSVVSENSSPSFEHSENKLIVSLNKSYTVNENITLTIFYRGTPVATGLMSFVFDSHNGQPSIWTLSEPYGASDWWPCKDTPADKTDSADIWITCRNDLIAVSNGTLVDEVDNRDGTKTYKWKNRYPVANYLISLAISNYEVQKDYFRYSETDSMLVIHYIYPENINELKPQLNKTIPMLSLFTDLFGEYPFIKEKYGHAQFGRGGMEHQTISSMGIFTDGVISHELAHQWFGDKVTCRNWENIWLNEGFATFCEGLYWEFLGTDDDFNSWRSYNMNRSKNASGSIYVQDISSISQIFNGERSYSKGSIVLHMLRGIVGDSVFFNILKNYLNDSSLAYSTAITEDFQRVVEETSAMSLDYFFTQWIYGENYPKYFLKWDCQKVTSDEYEIKINLEQSLNTYPIFFTMPIKIKLSTSAGDTLIALFNNAQKQEFVFRINGEPEQFTFDPDNYILKDVIFSDPPSLLPKFNLVQNYPNPFNAGTKIEYEIPTFSKVTLKVFNTLGEEVALLIDDNLPAGDYETSFNPVNLPSGIYFYTLNTGNRITTKKMVLLK